MIMRITWGRLNAGKWNAFEQAYNQTIVGKEFKGLRGRWLAQDVTDPDGGFAVSLWESLEDLEAYEQSDFFQKEALPQLLPHFAGQYMTYRCDVKYVQ